MPEVTFRTNLGTIDANAYGLDHSKCQAGQSLDVIDELAEKLAKRGLIEPLIKAVPQVAEIKAVPIPDGGLELPSRYEIGPAMPELAEAPEAPKKKSKRDKTSE